MSGTDFTDAPLSAYHCSVHNHTTFCDGKGTPEEMAAAAYRAGVRYFGFSGHSHTPLPLDGPYVMDRDTSEYRRRVLELRREYAGRMEILLGIEWDSRADGELRLNGNLYDGGEVRTNGGPEGYDYWIGSVHHVLVNGTDCPVDYDAEHFGRAIRDVFGGDVYAFAEAYFRDAAETAARRPTILGHIDLFSKFNEREPVGPGQLSSTGPGRVPSGGPGQRSSGVQGRFFDPDHPRYRRAALGALEAADPSATLLEINTGAMSRGYRTAPYPAAFLLEAWRRRGGRVIVTADAHSPDAVLYGYGAALEAARAAGFRECAVLTAAGVRTCPL